MLKVILKEDIKSIKEVYSYKDALEKGLIPENFKVKYVRIVSFGENVGPCGGTHIDHVKDMQKVEVTKIQKKSKNVRVNYQV